MRSLHLLAVLTSLFASWNCFPSCLAQSGTTAAGASFSRRQAPKEIRHEILNSMPGDIKLPIPPDAKFMAGYRSQYNASRLITELRFRTNNTRAKIVDWYQQSLTGSGWTVKLDGSGAQTSIMASKGGLICNMNFRDTGAMIDTKPSSSSSIVMLNYSENR
jgi:hypothetical protein